MNLFHKLTCIFMLISLIPLIIFGMVLYIDASKSLDESSMEFATALSAQIVSSMNGFIERNNYVTRSVLNDNEIIRKLDDDKLSISTRVEQQLKMRKMLQRLCTINPDVASVYIVTKKERCYDLERNGAGIDVAVLLEQEWFQNAMADETDYSITPIHNKVYYDRDQDGITVSVVRKIYSIYGYEGILVMDMDPSAMVQFTDGFNRVRNNYNIKVNIVDRNDNILYDSDLSTGRASWNDLDKETLLTFQKNIKDYCIVTETTDSLGVKVNVVIPRSALLLRIHKLRVVTMVLIIVLIGIAVLFAILIGKSLSNPIRELQDGMADLEQGNYKLLKIDRGSDEIGNLVESYNHMVEKVRVLIEEVYLAEIKQKNARYMALQTQINPHMLFNTLESIRMKAMMGGDDNTAGMIKLLARMFRTALDSNSENHSVKKEMEYATSYIALQNMRFKDLFVLETDVDRRFYEVGIIPIVFQPILENSIEHGSRDRLTQLHLRICAEETEDNRVRFLIEDDGKGMEQSRFRELTEQLENIGKEDVSITTENEDGHRSIGLINIAERIMLRYGDRGAVRLLSSDHSGTRIEVVIRLIYL